MSTSNREQRLKSDLEAMQALKEVSTILEFDTTGEPPDRYTIIFRGKGIAPDSSSRSEVEHIDLHRCDVRLPYSYPQRPPDVRWLTPIFHPNISFSGFLNLREIGITWEKDLGLALLCERLWDVARGAYINLDKSANYAARNFFADEANEVVLPVDRRPLRDKTAPSSSNVIRYERRDKQPGDAPAAAAADSAESADVFYIGEDTPAPEMPKPRTAARRIVRPRRDDDGDDEVFYIGDE